MTREQIEDNAIAAAQRLEANWDPDRWQETMDALNEAMQEADVEVNLEHLYMVRAVKAVEAESDEQ